MTPKQRDHLEGMVEPSWRHAGCPRHGDRFQVYTRLRDLKPLTFAPSGPPTAATFYIARVALECGDYDGRPARRLVAKVEDTDIEVTLRVEFR